jgi:hypothetical protein
MSIQKSINYSKIYSNISNFSNKINSKSLSNFWIIADRSDFKPLKNINNVIITDIKDIIHLLKDKLEYYLHKKIINIKLNFNNILLEKLYSNPSFINFNHFKDKGIFIVKITIYNISNSLFYKSPLFSNIKFLLNDFLYITPKFKTVEVLSRLVIDKNITTSKDSFINYSSIKLN